MFPLHHSMGFVFKKKKEYFEYVGEPLFFEKLYNSSKVIILPTRCSPYWGVFCEPQMHTVNEGAMIFLGLVL